MIHELQLFPSYSSSLLLKLKHLFSERTETLSSSQVKQKNPIKNETRVK